MWLGMGDFEDFQRPCWLACLALGKPLGFEHGLAVACDRVGFEVVAATFRGVVAGAGGGISFPLDGGEARNQGGVRQALDARISGLEGLDAGGGEFHLAGSFWYSLRRMVAMILASLRPVIRWMPGRSGCTIGLGSVFMAVRMESRHPRQSAAVWMVSQEVWPRVLALAHAARAWSGFQ